MQNNVLWKHIQLQCRTQTRILAEAALGLDMTVTRNFPKGCEIGSWLGDGVFTGGDVQIRSVHAILNIYNVFCERSEPEKGTICWSWHKFNLWQICTICPSPHTFFPHDIIYALKLFGKRSEPQKMHYLYQPTHFVLYMKLNGDKLFGKRSEPEKNYLYEPPRNSLSTWYY